MFKITLYLAFIDLLREEFMTVSNILREFFYKYNGIFFA